MISLSYRTFLSNIKKNQSWYKVYTQLGSPRPFDVSLRDGLQQANPEYYPLLKKRNIYHEIVFNDSPRGIEIGSVVSNKILPIFSDSIKLCDEAIEHQNRVVSRNENSDIYLLVPNEKKIRELIDKSKCSNFSLITSVSNAFQKKNTNKTLEETKKEIHAILETIKIKNIANPKVKLYVSCINECPLSGKVDNDFIVNEILNYDKLSVNEICLSDTCGSLEVEDFEYIVDACKYFGMPMSKLSLHLHVKPKRENIIKQLIYSALDRNVKNFDVSMINTGGCSVTMKSEDMSPNLSYALYYNALTKYIERKCDDEFNNDK
jgi:hypothetical protein